MANIILVLAVVLAAVYFVLPRGEAEAAGPQPSASAAQPEGPPPVPGDLCSTARLAGFYAAHAVWSIEDGETLIPIVALQEPDGTHNMIRMAMDRLEEGVAAGRQTLERGAAAAHRGVLLFDGKVTLESGKVDAIVIEAVEYTPAPRRFTIAVAYRPATDPKGLAIYRPKFIFSKDDPPPPGVAEAFFAGVDSHPQGSLLWNAKLDQSH